MRSNNINLRLSPFLSTEHDISIKYFAMVYKQ